MFLFCIFDSKENLAIGLKIVQPNEQTAEENHSTNQADYNSSEKAVDNPGEKQEAEALKQQNRIHENDNPNQVFLDVEKGYVKTC